MVKEHKDEDVKRNSKPLKVKEKSFKNESKKYLRGEGNKTKGLQDKKLKMVLSRNEYKAKKAAVAAAKAEILLPTEQGFLEAEGMEKTQRFTQRQIKEAVDVAAAKKVFTLNLDTFGPYKSRYSRNGRHLLLGGKLGHLAVCDWHSGRLACEVQVKETVRDVSFLHNETMFAAAQKKYVYIYDNQGIELHCLRNHIEVNRMTYLPYHFLLATVGNAGYLKFQDTSTGNLVSELRTRLGRCDCLELNPHNAVSLLGHTNGTVTMWAPTMSAPLVKMLCHKGQVAGIAADPSGKYLATSGLDGQLHIWDLRTYKKLHSYFMPTPAVSLDISQRGLLGVGFGTHVEIWKDALTAKAKAPYMRHDTHGAAVRDIHFCPYEDVLGLGHSKGFSSILVPGSGEANFDSFEANPFQTKKQRREGEVHQLLDKLQPEMISLNPHFIGNVDRAPQEVIAEERKMLREEHMTDRQREKKAKRHARGRDKSGKRYKKKQANIVEEKKGVHRQHRDDSGESGKGEDQGNKSVLDRFKFRS